MPAIKTYEDMTVEIIRSTESPGSLLSLAMSITMGLPENEIPPQFNHSKGLYLILAEHMSMFEHVSYTFLIQGISRSLLAQLTRQRTAKPTSGSQHYQLYNEYPCAVRPGTDDDTMEELTTALAYSYDQYTELLNLGEPREEARQVLPNAATVNFLWTIDARNLFYFLRQRLCHRNVLEMRIFAERVLSLVRPDFPELFDHAGPQCFKGNCFQGFLKCKQGAWKQKELK